MFRRRSSGATGETAQGSADAQGQGTPAQEKPAAETAKGRPTRKRSEAEKGRYQSISGSRAGPKGGTGPRTAESKARDKNERSRRYEAMKRGEDWALGPRDAGPLRRLARDYIDSKRRASEYYMYLVVVVLAATFLSRSKAVSTYLSPFVVLLVLVIAVDAVIINRGLKKAVAQRYPGQSARGLTMYAVFRALQIRRFRIPAPQVKPGDKY